MTDGIKTELNKFIEIELTSGESVAPAVQAQENFKGRVDRIEAEIMELYQQDDQPWVIGYSGGKDSSAVLQLVWQALAKLKEEGGKLPKPVHVISTNTLVENPIVDCWVEQSHKKMVEVAEGEGLPIEVHRLQPRVENSFWVNLIGRGYPAPRPKFRWCTERLKIQPSNDFIKKVVELGRDVLLIIGTRKAESSRRASNMAKQAEKAIQDRITPNASLPGSWVYTPIEDWSNDEVWQFLHLYENPWGYNNQDLQAMYRSGSEDNECPVQMDTSAPSCGNSRFGCWVCTLVDEDKSLAAMHANDPENNRWMKPMIELREELHPGSPGREKKAEEERKKEKGLQTSREKWQKDRNRRDFRRMSGHLHHYRNKDGDLQPIPGPYTQKARVYWLQRVLETQQAVRKLAGEALGEIRLITDDELEEIRRIWLVEKHEVEDLAPQIFADILGVDAVFPGLLNSDDLFFRPEIWEELKKVCEESLRGAESLEGGEEPSEEMVTLHYELVRNLLHIEQQHRTQVKRVGLKEKLAKAIERGFYDGREDAQKRLELVEGKSEAVKTRDAKEEKKELEDLRTERKASQMDAGQKEFEFE